MAETPEKTDRLSIARFPARAYQLKQIRSIVQSAMNQIGCTQLDNDKIVLAINEACMNVIQHAYGEAHCGEIVLEIFHELGTDGEHHVVFRLTDFATPVDESSICSRNLEEIRPGGLGVHIIHEVMDSMEFKRPVDGTGNILELRKRVNCKDG